MYKIFANIAQLHLFFVSTFFVTLNLPAFEQTLLFGCWKSYFYIMVSVKDYMLSNVLFFSITRQIWGNLVHHAALATKSFSLYFVLEYSSPLCCSTRSVSWNYYCYDCGKLEWKFTILITSSICPLRLLLPSFLVWNVSIYMSKSLFRTAERLVWISRTIEFPSCSSQSAILIIFYISKAGWSKFRAPFKRTPEAICQAESRLFNLHREEKMMILFYKTNCF